MIAVEHMIIQSYDFYKENFILPFEAFCQKQTFGFSIFTVNQGLFLSSLPDHI